METVRLTDAQRAVVEHRGGALLVSAAAGSGKTKVLVERLLRRICDEKDPCDMEQFLIITFTTAAASELRMKIADELSRRLAEDSSNRHLRRQLTRIYLTQISTVHAFCASILRDYAHELDIPADFRVGETAECLPLRQKAMERTLDEAYGNPEGNPDVAAFLRTLGYGRDDRRAAGLIEAVFDQIQSHARPEQWMEECRRQVEAPQGDALEQTIWGRYLMEEFRAFLDDQIARMEIACRMISERAELSPYLPVFEEDRQILRRLRQAERWDDVAAQAEPSFSRLPQVRNCEDLEGKNRVREIRVKCKKQLTKKLTAFSCDEKTAMEELRRTGRELSGLLHLAGRFSAHYGAVKRSRHLLDFSDLEHLAIRLLTTPAGAPTAAAGEISDRFREVMVDEYQDSSQVQDAIYRAVSHNGEDLFLVGDVKQSIYSFRLADPGIFLEKYRNYAVRENTGEPTPRKILLSANFRSHPDILDAVNHVCRVNMSEAVGGLEYGDEEALVPGLPAEEPETPSVELHCIEANPDDQGLESGEKDEIEARFTAARIARLLREENVRAEDVAILLRSAANVAPIFAKELERLGIPATTDRETDLLETAEVNILLGFLQIIQNPHQDIPLLAAMASPLGGFTADRLALLRSGGDETDLYDALTELAAEEPYGSFLARLEGLRLSRRRMELTEFLDEVCESLEVFSVFGAMEDGRTRCRNLRRFLELAQAAKTAGITELSGFLRYVEDLRQEGFRLPSPPAGKPGSVTITTIHKSKGLEYPVVFLCGLSRRFNDEDLRQNVLLDPVLCAGCSVVDRDLMVKYPSVAKIAIREKKRREMISEELRILYVAMTRAKRKLIMTYCRGKLDQHLQEIATLAEYPAQPGVAGGVSSPGDWILLAASLRPEAGHLFGGGMRVTDLPGRPWLVRYHRGDEEFPIPEAPAEETAAESVEDDSAVDHRYACRAATRLPAKLTATQLKGGALEAETAEGAARYRDLSAPQVRRRPFRSGAKDLTAAERGTALHQFLQFCRYEACIDPAGVEAEKRRLVEREFLTAAQAESVDSAKVVAFFTSETGRMVLRQSVRREFKFSLLVEAGKLLDTGAAETVMLQGVVDCFAQTEEGLVVLDFKTDRIRPGGEAERAEAYRPQLDAYAMALERIFGRPVIRRILYFFETGTTWEL